MYHYYTCVVVVHSKRNCGGDPQFQLEFDLFILILPNTQKISHTFLSMHGSQYVTNQFDVRIPIRGLITNLRKMLVAKFFSSSHDEDHETPWLQNSLVTKLYGVQTQQLLQEKDELGQILSPVIICMNTTLLHSYATFDGP